MPVIVYDENKICNIALTRLGGLPIESVLDPTTDMEETCANIYHIRAEELLAHEWNWTNAELELARLPDVTPVKTFRYAFQLPSNMLSGPRAVYGDGSELNSGQWKVVGDKLYCDFQTVAVDYGNKPPPSIWPAYFVNLVTKAVEADLAIPVREDRQLKADLLEEAFGPPIMEGRGGLFKIAKNLDAKNKPTQTLFSNGDPFTAARFGGFPSRDPRKGH